MKGMSLVVTRMPISELPLLPLKPLMPERLTITPLLLKTPVKYITITINQELFVMRLILIKMGTLILSSTSILIIPALPVNQLLALLRAKPLMASLYQELIRLICRLMWWGISCVGGGLCQFLPLQIVLRQREYISPLFYIHRTPHLILDHQQHLFASIHFFLAHFYNI